MKKITVLVSAFMLTAATTFAQTWEIGYPNAEDVTAMLSDGTLTISGVGDMQDFEWGTAPWFEISRNITSLVIEEDVTTIGNYAFATCSALSAISIPSSVITIGNYAFYHCSALNTISIPEGIITIGNYAFFYCTGLSTISIPKGVTTIGMVVFNGCSDLTAINVDNANENYSSDNGILYNKTKTTLLRCPEGKTGEITLPEDVITINYDAFYNCYDLTAINVDNANENLSSDNGILYNKTKTTLILCLKGKTGEVTIPEGVITIDHRAFLGCTYLSAVNIPKGVTTIGSTAFSNCNGLSTISIPESVTTIGASAFVGCRGLSSISNFAIVPQAILYNNYVFDGLTLSEITLYVPDLSLALYQSADVWKEFNIKPMSEKPSGINNISADSATIIGYYSLSGIKLPQEPQNGVYLIRYENGKVEKVVK